MTEATQPTDTAAAAATETPKADGRIKMLKKVPKGFADMKHPIDLSDESLKKLASGKTEEVARAEFIRSAWATRQYDRSAITKMVRVFGEDPEVKYQIIFQATKGHEGGPIAAPAAPSPAEGEAAAASE